MTSLSRPELLTRPRGQAGRGRRGEPPKEEDKVLIAVNVEYLHPYTRDADDRLAALRSSPAPPCPGQ